MPISDSQFATQAAPTFDRPRVNRFGPGSISQASIQVSYQESDSVIPCKGIRAKFDAGATEAPREFVNHYAVSEVQVESAASVRLLWREFVNAIHRQGTNFRS